MAVVDLEVADFFRTSSHQEQMVVGMGRGASISPAVSLFPWIVAAACVSKDTSFSLPFATKISVPSGV